MQHEQYAQLLLDAIRETLETMAFAEVVPFSMKIGERELMATDIMKMGLPDIPAETPPPVPTNELLGETLSDDDSWGNPLDLLDSDPWGENVQIPVPVEEETNLQLTEQVDFDKLMNTQDEWCWARLNVNSPELESIWFIVSQQLATQLGRMMYAMEDVETNTQALGDIIAELTNVLGGRLMLLLEEIIGKFTLEVPITGTGHPQLPDNAILETVMCKVLVDGVYPVISLLCFRNKEQSHTGISTLQAQVE